MIGMVLSVSSSLLFFEVLEVSSTIVNSCGEAFELPLGVDPPELEPPEVEPPEVEPPDVEPPYVESPCV